MTTPELNKNTAITKKKKIIIATRIVMVQQIQ